MDAASWERVKSVFQEAFERPAAEQPAFLEAACAGDAELRGAVERLLRAHASAAGFLDAPQALDFDRPPFAPPDLDDGNAITLPSHVGPYRVVRELGRGGMGTVYLAERDEPGLRKTVAAKVVRRGMDSAFVVSRFRTERQILAALEHPGIARLYDGGTTDEGLPYFVMEYVDGEDLLTYCDGRRLPITARLQLFLRVCEAVQYAHQRLVVHRDLKPSNVLVTAAGDPKLLDFGIAKLLSPQLGEEGAEETASVVRLMTPDYASPEQVRGERVTAASDSYSLGVILYELLCGHRPYRVRGREAGEVERAIFEQDVDPPSTALARTENVTARGGATVRITPTEVSARRQAAPGKLRWRLRGDLDNVALKALRKDPPERYATAAELGEDIRRHLEGFPVRARPARRAYRAAKFLRRHQAGVAAAAAAILSLLVGLALAPSLRWAARESFEAPCRGGGKRIAAFWPPAQRAEAQQAFLASGAANGQEAWDKFRSAFDSYAETWVAAHQEACEATRVRREQSEAVMDVRIACLERRLDEARALVALYTHPTAPMVADASLAPFRLRLLDSCSASSVLSMRLDPATPAQEQAAIPLRQALPRVLALFNAGRYPEGARAAEEALRQARDVGHPPLLAEALFLHGLLTGAMGDAQGAASTLREAVRTAKACHHDVAEADAWIELVWVTGKDLAKYEDALVLAEMAEAAVRATADRGERMALVHHYVGEVLGAMGRHSEALDRLRQALGLRERILGTDHPDAAKSLHNIAGILYQLGRYSEAEASFRAAHARFEKTLGPHHLLTGRAAANLGEALRAGGKLEEAEAHLLLALGVESAVLGTKALPVAFVHHNLGELLRTRKKPERALVHFRAALDVFETRRGASHPDVAYPLQGIGDALTDEGRAKEALPFLERSLSIRHAARTDPLRIAQSELALSRALVRARHGPWRPRAQRLLQSARDVFRRSPQQNAALLAQAAALEKELLR